MDACPRKYTQELNGRVNKLISALAESITPTRYLVTGASNITSAAESFILECSRELLMTGHQTGRGALYSRMVIESALIAAGLIVIALLLRP
jgi:hypothetical protein